MRRGRRGEEAGCEGRHAKEEGKLKVSMPEVRGGSRGRKPDVSREMLEGRGSWRGGCRR